MNNMQQKTKIKIWKYLVSAVAVAMILSLIVPFV